MVVGISFSLGAGLEPQTVFADLLEGFWGGLLDNGILMGALSTILLTLFLHLTQHWQGSRLQVKLDV